MTEPTTAPLKVVADQTVAQKVADIPVDPFTQDIIDKVNEAVEDPDVQVLVGRVTKKIPSNVRDIIYTVGIVLGSVTTVATAVAGILTGDAQLFAGTVASVALSLTNLLSKFNLSRTPEEVAAATA